MPFDAGGTFTRQYSWAADRDAGIKILAQRMDGEFNNYAGGLNQTFLRTGIVPMGGPLNMNSNPIVGVAGGTLISPGIRFESDTDTGVMQSGPGNLTLVVDGVAMMTATAAGVNIGGGVPLIVASGISVNGNVNATGSVVVSTPGIGGISLVTGSTTVTGWLSFNNVAGGIVSWIGQVPVGGGTLSYNSTSHQFNGAMGIAGGLTVTAGDIAVAAGHSITTPSIYMDGNFWLGIQTGNPLINFDANDFIRFNRAPNQFEHIIGGAAQLTVSTGSIQAGNSGSGIVYLGSGASYINADVNASTWLMKAPNYYFQIDKNTNILSLVMGGAIAYDVRPGGINMSLPLATTSSVSAGGVLRTQGAGIGDIQMQGGNAGVSGFLAFLQVDDGLQGWIGQQAPGGKINYWTSGAGHNFVGPIAAGDYYGTGVVKAATVYPGNDNNYYGIMISGNPYINFDAGDFIVYDRALNQWNFNVAGSYPLVISPTAVYGLGLELGYRDIPIRTVNTPGGNVSAADRGRAVQFLPGAQNYGLPDLQQGSVVTLVNSSGIVQTIVEAGVQLYWANTNSRGNVNLAPGALATVYWTGGGGCVIAGTGTYR